MGGEGQYFSIPKSALARQGADSVVFVQRDGGFSAMPVNVISEQGEQAVVDGKFTGNEKIAVTGIAAIKGAWIGLGAE